MVKGDTVSEVLEYVQFDAENLQERMQISIGAAVRDGRLSRAEGSHLLRLYESGLSGYTYLEGQHDD